MSGMQDLVEISEGQWIDPSIVGALQINVTDGDAANKKLTVRIRSHAGMELALFEEDIETANWLAFAYGEQLYSDNFIEVLRGRASGEWARRWHSQIANLVDLYKQNKVGEVKAWVEAHMPLSQVDWTPAEQEAVLWARWLFVAVIAETANAEYDAQFARQVFCLVTGEMDEAEVRRRFGEHEIEHPVPGTCNFGTAQKILQKRILRGIFLLGADD